MRLLVNHSIAYRFTQPQQRLVQLLRLTPGSHYGQNIVDWRIDVDCDARLRSARDGFGNETAMLYVEGPVERIGITVAGEVLTDDRAGVVAGTLETLPPQVYLQETALTRADAAIRALAEGAASHAAPLDRAHALNRAIAEVVTLDAVATTPELGDAAATLADGHGAANALAMLFASAARTIGLPARVVAGYRCPPGDPPAPARPHAWAEAHVEHYGWIGFDPGHEICPDDNYVRVAIGLDYRDAAPVSGARIGGGVEELEVDVRVASEDQPQA